MTSRQTKPPIPGSWGAGSESGAQKHSEENFPSILPNLVAALCRAARSLGIHGHDAGPVWSAAALATRTYCRMECRQYLWSYFRLYIFISYSRYKNFCLNPNR